MYPSVPISIPPEVPILPPRVNIAQPTRVDKGGPSSATLCIDSTMPKTHEANSVAHQISGVAQEYRNLIKGPEMKIWEISFANELGQLDQGIREVKGKNTVMFIPKSQVPKEKKVTCGKIEYKYIKLIFCIVAY